MLFTALFAVIIPFIHRISKKITAIYAVNKRAIHCITLGCLSCYIYLDTGIRSGADIKDNNKVDTATE